MERIDAMGSAPELGNYLFLYRSLLEWRYLKDPVIPRVWMYLLLRASWSGGQVFYRNTLVELERGQLAIARADIAAALDLSEKQVRRALLLLEKSGEIRADFRAGLFNVVTVVKWDTYQPGAVGSGPTEGGGQGMTQGRPRADLGPTDKEGKEREEGKKVKNKKPPKSPKGDSAVIPAELETPEFQAAWSDWKAHRAEIRKPLTPTCLKQQLAKLAAMGTTRAVIAIKHSIANGWTGLFEPKPDAPVNGNGHRRAPTPTILLDITDGSDQC